MVFFLLQLSRILAASVSFQREQHVLSWLIKLLLAAVQIDAVDGMKCKHLYVVLFFFPSSIAR